MAEDDLRAFVGPRADLYLARWRMIALSGRSTGWNWPAALLTGFWLLYRRMYLWFLPYAMATLFFWFPGGISGVLWFFVTTVVFGLFGDWLYLQHARKKVRWASAAMGLSGDRRPMLSRMGGVDPISPVIWGGFLVLILLVVLAVIGIVAVSVMNGAWTGIPGAIRELFGTR
ncbi:MAG: hypothetical protein M3O22_03725 [Pseudomonadota bacterium]|nr:hypothetical protein [Pseudomonadota bacterium]